MLNNCHIVGLIDPNENDPISSAQRELKEETGYWVPKEKFDLVRVPVAYEPGLTNSCCYVAKVTIDTQSMQAPILQELEEDEWSLQVISLPINNLLEKLLGKKKRRRKSSDTKSLKQNNRIGKVSKWTIDN